MAAPAPPHIVALKGDVEILSLKAENQPAMLYEGKRYYYHKARIGEQVPIGAILACNGEARAKIVYPSGTSVWLGPGTMLQIIEADEAPSGESSTLDLVYGRIRSLVTKTKKWDVKTRSVVDGVRGTDFVVAYSPVTGNQTSVISGRVEVRPVAPQAAKQEVKADEAAHETSAGQIAVEPINKVQVISALELTAIKPEAQPAPQVAELETRSHELLVKEIRATHPEVLVAGVKPETVDAADLNRKLIEKHLENVKAQEPALLKPFTKDLEKFKQMDDSK